MDDQRKRELAGEMNELAQRFWAGEAEICRRFWGAPRTTEEQAHWLRLQVYKEMFGSGLHGHPGGIIRGFIEKLSETLPHAQTKDQRDDFERDIRVLGEEFNHYRLFTDILEEATGEPVRLEKLRGWQLPEDVEAPAGAPVRPRGPGPHRRGRDRLHGGRGARRSSTRDAR